MSRDDPGNAAPPEIGIPNPHEPPERLTRFNDRYSVAVIDRLLEGDECPTEHGGPDRIKLENFESETCFAPKVPIGSLLDDYADDGKDLVLIASVDHIDVTGGAVDAIAAFARQRGVPLIVLAFATRDEWDVGIPYFFRQDGNMRLCMPSKSLAEHLRIATWNMDGAPARRMRVANGLFLVYKQPSTDKYRFAGSWLAPFVSQPHDFMRIDRQLQLVRRARFGE